MKIRIEPGSICLARNQTLEIEQPLGFRIVCRSGSLWITQDGDQRDIIVESGDAFEFDRPGVAIVNAFKPATVSVEPVPRGHAPRHPALARALAVLSHRFAGVHAA